MLDISIKNRQYINNKMRHLFHNFNFLQLIQKVLLIQVMLLLKNIRTRIITCPVLLFDIKFRL
jgi:hypothetical protein